MITDNDKIKAISLNSASVVNEFEGFASNSNNICLLNGGKGKFQDPAIFNKIKTLYTK